MRSFTLVGAGRLGTVLAAALARRGWTPELIVDTDARAAREARHAIGAGRATVAVRASSRLGAIVLVAVPDSEIARVAAGLAASGVRWAGRTVLHTSGLQPARLLAPLARRGALVASLHPVQSFARKDAPASVFAGITWGVEGDPAAVATCVRIVRALRGRVLLLSEQDKPLYHAACSLASNALVALEATAAGALRGGRDRGPGGRSHAPAPGTRNFTERKRPWAGKGPDGTDPQGGRRHGQGASRSPRGRPRSAGGL